MATTPPTVRRPALTSPLNIFLLSLLGVVGLIYFFVGIYTHDPLWFWPVFDQQPSLIVIHCYGQTIRLTPDSPQFIPLTYLINQQLSAERRVDNASITPETYNDFLQSQTAVSIEMRFSHPIRIHSSRTYLSNVDTLLILLSGEENRWAQLYGARGELPMPGSLRVVNSQAIADFLFQKMLCVGPCKDW